MTPYDVLNLRNVMLLHLRSSVGGTESAVRDETRLRAIVCILLGTELKLVLSKQKNVQISVYHT